MTPGPQEWQTMQRRIHLGLLDSNSIARAALADWLARHDDFDLVWHAARLDGLPDLRSALAAVRLVICHLDDHEIDLVDAVRAIRHHGPQGHILAIAARPDRPELGRIVAAGVDGLISRDSGLDGLEQAIHAVASGAASAATMNALQAVRAWGVHEALRAEHAAGFARLTPRELDVLRAMAAGLSDQRIADHLHVGLPTVRSHVSHILDKTRSDSRLQVVVRGIAVGVLDPAVALERRQ
jgi:DNA-binding NarL/FixJ family response regulator